MRKRIAVTGLGAVSPCGNTVAENWKNIKNKSRKNRPVSRNVSTNFKIPEKDYSQNNLSGPKKSAGWLKLAMALRGFTAWRKLAPMKCLNLINYIRNMALLPIKDMVQKSLKNLPKN